MFPVYFYISLGTITNLLVTSRALPLPTTPLTPIPRRYLDPAFDKDPFKDGYSLDYQDVPKRSIAQQAHENAKKFPRNGWGQPTPLPGDNKGPYAPNAFKDQDHRSMMETNMIPQDFGDPYKKNYYNNYDYEAVHHDDALLVTDEVETSYLEPPNPWEPSTSTLNYGSIGSPNINHPVYPTSDVNTVNHDVESITNMDVEVELSSDEYYEDNENDKVDIFIPMATPTIMQQTQAAGLKSTQKMQQIQHVKVMVPIDANSEGNESEHPKVKEERVVTTKQTIKPPPTEHKVNILKDTKGTVIDEPIHVRRDKDPKEREIFSRTTTITKTTTWYVNSDNEITVVEEGDERPQPLKFQYLKTIKTTTSGPVPWYLQDFEDVIFEEEDEKSKTILDKMSHLKGMSPTAITSFTTAPNPWSTELHEEVNFEEPVAKKESPEDTDVKFHHVGPHPSPLEHLVDYLPRTQVVNDESEVPEKEEVKEEGSHQTVPGQDQENKLTDMPHETHQEHPTQHTLEVSHPIDLPNIPKMDFSNSPNMEFNNPTVVELPIPPTIDFAHYPINGPHPKSHLPLVFEEDHFVPEFLNEHHNHQDTMYMNDMHNSINPTQTTTPKPMTTLPPTESTFTPHPQVGSHQVTEQTHPPQQSYSHPQPLPSQHPPLFGNHPQQQTNWEHPGGGGGREIWDSWNEHQQAPNREVHTWSNELGRPNLDHTWPNIDHPKPNDLPRPTIDLPRPTIEHQWPNHEHQRPTVELQRPSGDHLPTLHPLKMDVAHKDKIMQDEPGRHHWGEQEMNFMMGLGPMGHMFQNWQQFPTRPTRPRDL